MSKRPPLLGYNHNVRHAGQLFHVQTEDSGLSRLYITTHVFREGTILSTARCSYAADDLDADVQKKMQAQHKTMLKRLRNGDFDNMSEAQLRSAAQAELSGERVVEPVQPAPAQVALHLNSPREGLPESTQATLPLILTRTPTVPPVAATPAESSEPRPNAPTRPPLPPREPKVQVQMQLQPSADSAPREVMPERTTAELLRPHENSTPVEIPHENSLPMTISSPPPPRTTPASLAARLGVTPAVSAPGFVPAPLPAQAMAALASESGERAIEGGQVLELEAEPEDEEDSLAPSMTIDYGTESGPVEDETPPSAYAATGRPRIVIQTPVSDALLASRSGVQPAMALLSDTPGSAPPTTVTGGVSGRPSRGTRPIMARPHHTSLLRARPTAEGISVQRVATTTEALEALRITLPQARPTNPRLPTVPPGEDFRGIDETVLAYLSKDLARDAKK